MKNRKSFVVFLACCALALVCKAYETPNVMTVNNTNYKRFNATKHVHEYELTFENLESVNGMSRVKKATATFVEENQSQPRKLTVSLSDQPTWEDKIKGGFNPVVVHLPTDVPGDELIGKKGKITWDFTIEYPGKPDGSPVSQLFSFQTRTYSHSQEAFVFFSSVSTSELWMRRLFGLSVLAGIISLIISFVGSKKPAGSAPSPDAA